MIQVLDCERMVESDSSDAASTNTQPPILCLHTIPPMAAIYNPAAKFVQPIEQLPGHYNADVGFCETGKNTVCNLQSGDDNTATVSVSAAKNNPAMPAMQSSGRVPGTYKQANPSLKPFNRMPAHTRR